MKIFTLRRAVPVIVFFAINVSAAVRYVNVNNASPSPPYTSWPTASTSIQNAINAAAAGDLVLVTNGIYQTGGRRVFGSLTNRVAVTKPLVLQSVNGPEVTIIRGYKIPGTVIGDSAVRCVYLTNGAVMIGFTLTNGATREVLGDYFLEASAGGAYCASNVVVSNCFFRGNTGFRLGGGVSGGTLYNCVFSDNSAGSGGGAYNGMLNNCIFTNNWTTVGASGHGGGAYESVLNNCLLRGNTADWGGGGMNSGTATNCTIVENSARFGGGAANCALYNTILYYNTALDRPNYYNQTLNYCCTVPASGIGGFTNPPLFMNQAAGDFRLSDLSPCVNAGNNAFAPAGLDLGGKPRIVGATVDLGAHELQTPFQLPPGPYTHTRPATAIRTNRATLNGVVVPRGLPSLAWFEWGQNGVYDHATPTQPVGAGAALAWITTDITGLVPRNIYQFRLVASNPSGVVHGVPQKFTTGRRVYGWGDNSSGQTNVPAGLTNAVNVSAGGGHSLALRNDGSVTGWGENYYGQATVPGGLSNVVIISAGGTHSLALRSDGTVVAWGDNSDGKRIVPNGLSNVVAIVAGGTGSMALRSDGSVVAWGYNYFGQTNVPLDLTNVVAVDAGNYFNVALKADGTVVAWGENYDHETNVPPGLGGVVAIAAGSDHNLALRADGLVAAWGIASSGESSVPEDLTDVIGVSAGGYHNLALKSDGALVTWGSSYFGQTSLPADLNNIAAFSAGGTHSLAIGNKPPSVFAQSVAGPRDDDLIVTLQGDDSDGDPIVHRIVAPPATGALYQCDGGVRGAAIVASQTIVTDPFARVIFAPAPGGTGNPYATFSHCASDGVFTSPPADVTIGIVGKQPFAFTQIPTLTAASSTTLNGMATPNGLLSVAWFEWGEQGSSTATTVPTNVENGLGVVRVSVTLSNLLKGTPYQCRLVVSNTAGVVYGFPQMFGTAYRVRSWGNNIYGQTNVPAGLANVVAVAGGGDFSLALRADGTVVGWGIATYGPTNVPAGLTNVTAIAAGYAHSMALKNDGTVTAWGSLLGGAIIPAFVPAGLSNVVAVSGGLSHSVALKADGTVLAWGFNSIGQANVPGGLTNVVAISARQDHTLALKADGTVVAWGDFLQGQTEVPAGLSNVVGITASSVNSVVLKADRTPVSWGGNWGGQNAAPPEISNLVSISAGGIHTLALETGGTVTAWGNNDFGQAVVPMGLSSAVAVAAGFRHNLVLLKDTAPKAFPNAVSVPPNQDVAITLNGTDVDADLISLRILSLTPTGQLYQYTNGVRGVAITTVGTVVSDPSGRVIFAPVPGTIGNPYSSFSYAASDGDAESAPANVVIAIIGPLFSFTLPATEISGVGARLNGMIAPKGFAAAAWFEWGNTMNYDHTTSVENVGAGGNVVHFHQHIGGLPHGQVIHFRLVASNASTVIYGADQQFITGGSVVAWGDNSAGQAQSPPDLNDAVALAGGLSHSIALKTDGTVTAWGNNAYGETSIPSNLTNVAAIAAGGFHNLLLLADGTVIAWGRNNLGQTNVPPGLSNAVAVAGGGSHSLALRNDGWVTAWGNNSHGQAVVPPGLSNVVGIAAGWYHSVALRDDGTVAVWGNNAFGQTNVAAGLSNVVWVGAGLYHTLALRRDGTMAAWGYNGSGQTTVPPGLSNIVAATSGGSHNLALGSDGLPTGWGYNYYSQVTAPFGVSNVVSIAAGGAHSLAIVPSHAPVALAQNIVGYVNQDLLLTLHGLDPNGDSLGYRIVSLPAAGNLYQFVNGGRGSLVVSSETELADADGRIIFAPAPNESGNPYALISFRVNDGVLDSTPATVTIGIILPQVPEIRAGSSTWTANGGFEINFTGASNATYRVWASTNLVDWQPLGFALPAAPGLFHFLDLTTTNSPQRFYRAGAP